MNMDIKRVVPGLLRGSFTVTVVQCGILCKVFKLAGTLRRDIKQEYFH